MEETGKENKQPAEEQLKEKKPKKNRDKSMSLKSILGGDVLANDFFRRQVRLLILVMVLTIIYISNRYSCQQEMIEIDRLKKKLTDIKYDALTRSSELTEKSRQSRIEEYISRSESTLGTSTNPPFLVTGKDKNATENSRE